MTIINDFASKYKDTKRKIHELENELISIKQEAANYKVQFGKYKNKTLAEIADIDLQYYQWLKRKNLIPFTVCPEIDTYIMDAINRHTEYELASEYERMKRKQGYSGRYMI